MAELKFHKMHGLGNDFVVIDNRDGSIKLSKVDFQQLADRRHGVDFQQLADRRHGVGCDQVIVLNPSSDYDAEYQFFNSDGSQAEQCGNGQRCIAYYLFLQDASQSQFSVSGLAGIIHSQVLNSRQVRVSMGGVNAIKKNSQGAKVFYDVDLGNPHRVMVKDSIDKVNLQALKDELCERDVNLEIVEIIHSGHIKIRVHERGTGETMACGSGACAVVAALQNDFQLKSKVRVSLPGGDLMIEYNPEINSIHMSGPASHVFQGEIKL